MRRLIMFVAVFFGAVGVTVPAQAKAYGSNGQIAFQRADPTVCRDCVSSYRVNPDGTHEKLLLAGVGNPRWSPDGTHIAFLSDCSFGGACGATLVNPDTGGTRDVPNPDPAAFNEFFGCIVWSPDGTRLACDAVGDAEGVTGIYTIRSSDGGGLTRILSCSTECVPTDYSPDGKRLVVIDADSTGRPELFVVRLSGSGLRQVTPTGFDADGHDGVASWSSNGTQIVFGGHGDADHRTAIFVVNPDGSELHQVPVPGCGGARSDPRSIACFDPSWSPDGSKIVFVRASSKLSVRNIYTADAGGGGLEQVTYESGGLQASTPDWGPHPLAS